MFNIQIHGRLIKDSEVRTFDNNDGSKFQTLRFTVSATLDRKKKDGEEYKPSHLVGVRVNGGKRVETLQRMLLKGVEVFVQGPAEVRDSDGKFFIDISNAESLTITKYADRDQQEPPSGPEIMKDLAESDVPF